MMIIRLCCELEVIIKKRIQLINIQENIAIVLLRVVYTKQLKTSLIF